MAAPAARHSDRRPGRPCDVSLHSTITLRVMRNEWASLTSGDVTLNEPREPSD